METPLRKSNNLKEIVKSNYKRKFLYLALSPISQSKTKTRNKSLLKSIKDSYLSASPEISILKKSFLFSQNIKRIEKRNSTSTSLSKIKLFNQFDNKESIIYNKKLIKKGSYNILVAVRVRPLNQKEELISTDETINVENKNTIILKDPNGYINPNNIRAKEQFLTYDYAFDKNETQENIFNNTTKFLINGVVNGYNATVFAYGATGAGKTYTMLGNDENPGIMPFTLKELFNEIKLYPQRKFKIKLWYLEIYNENIRDLLVNNSENLELREDPTKGLIVNGITEKETNSTEDILSLLKKGNKNRTTEETDANETSSRSHAILQILVSYKEKENNIVNENLTVNNINNNDIKFGKLSLIDLAGSERASMTGSKGMRLIEGGNINKSLLVLGNCINALCESNIKGNKPHIPYRDSKLTRLLKDSLGGNSRTVMIANVSPFIYNFDDTYNTLKYAERAKHIKTQVSRNILNYNSQYLRNNYLNVIRKLHLKINDLENKLLIYETNGTISQSNEFSITSRIHIKNEVEIIDNNNVDEKNKKINIISEKNDNNEICNNIIDTIKENNIELESSNINSFIEENNKITLLIEEYIQQSQAEVKIKQKIMGIHYDIYLLNKIIKEKESKKQNISEEKKKLKSYKKILEKNISCFNEISQKNDNLLLKYIDNKNTESEQETKNTNIIDNENEIKDDKIELNELQRRFLYMVSKICKIQMENIEIKYNYALLKDEITSKDKKIKNLEKQIEFRDIIIKEKIALDNNNITDEELNKKHNILLSEQQKAKFKTFTRFKNNEKNNENNNKENNNDKNINSDAENTIHVHKSKNKNRRKHYSFHPRNSSFVNTNKIHTPSKEKNNDNSILAHKLNNNDREYENNMINYKSSDINLEKYNFDNNNNYTIDVLTKNNNEIVGKEFNDILKNFDISTITSDNFGDKITIKKRSSGAISIDNKLNNNKIKNNEKIKKDNNKNKKKEKEKGKEEDEIDDEFGEDTNNKTLKSVLNDIKIMNSDINTKLNIIEKNEKNASSSQIKPISRTMANIENMNNYINSDSKNNTNRKNNNKKSSKVNNINSLNNLKIKSKKSDNITRKKNKNVNSLKTSSTNINLITANTLNSKNQENDNIIIDNIIKSTINNNNDSTNIKAPSFIISVNRNINKNKIKKLTLVPSVSSNMQLNTINTNKDIKNLKTKSPLCKTSSISKTKKGYVSSSTKTINNYHRMTKNNSTHRNKSLLANNIDNDDLRNHLRDAINNNRNKYKIKKYIKIEDKEMPNDSNNNSLDKININNEINNNINIDKIINSTTQNKEKTKLQLFYSEHLNKHKNNSPKNLTQKKISNADYTSKNSRSSINNNNDYDSSSIVDMRTNHDTIDNRKKKSFVCPKNKDKKEKNNKQIIKNIINSEKKKK